MNAKPLILVMAMTIGSMSLPTEALALATFFKPDRDKSVEEQMRASDAAAAAARAAAAEAKAAAADAAAAAREAAREAAAAARNAKFNR